jgi:hypothetical protein
MYNFPIHHLVHFYSKVWRKSCSKTLSPKWFRPEHRRTATSRTPHHALPPQHSRSAPRSPRRLSCAFPRRLCPEAPHFLPCATRRPPPVPYARAEQTVGPSAVPRTGRDAAVPRRHLRRHPVVTGEHAPYKRRHCLPTGEHRARRPPLPPSRQARPSTSTPSGPTTSHPSLGPAKAQALAPCPRNVAAPPEYRPQRPMPSAAADRARQRHPTSSYGPRRVVGEPWSPTHRPPTEPRQGLAGIGRTAAGRRPKGPIARGRFFPGSFS